MALSMDLSSSTIDQIKQMVNSRDHIHSNVAMTILLVSWGMLFATLFLVYAILRGTTDVWPPAGIQKVPLFYPTLSSLLILFSSFFYILFERSFIFCQFDQDYHIKVDKKKVISLFILSFNFGMGFLFFQNMIWGQFKKLGHFVERSIYSSLIYSFTWIHAAHVILGLLGFIWIASFLFRKNQNDLVKWYFRIKNIGKYWHFMSFIWFAMYFSLFVF